MYIISIIIVTYNSAEDIMHCLSSIQNTKADLNIEVFIVDNRSCDNTTSLIKKHFSNYYLIINETNIGFSSANNQAIIKAHGEYILLLNPDTILLPNSLQEMVNYMKQNIYCGICGPILLDKTGLLHPLVAEPNFLNSLLNILGNRKLRFSKGQDKVNIISGACFMFRKGLINEVGLLDEDLFWCEDADYCTRVRKKGYQTSIVEKARVVHLVGQSAKANLALMLEKQYTSKITYLLKHSSVFEVICVLFVFEIQIFLRIIRWGIKNITQNSEDGKIRVNTFIKLLIKLPSYALKTYFKIFKKNQ